MTKDDSFTALLVYIDDIIVGSNSKVVITSVKDFLDKRFKIKIYES